MNTHPMKLVTIIGEALARKPLKKVLAEVGAHGYTLFAVEGDGSQGRRTGDIQEFANIQVEVIVPPAVSEQLLARLEKEFFPQFAMVAYETDIRVVRREKF
jgi:nitrogen regulatory protein P-II 2